MSKQVTKRCHWVSQSYLRTFAADEGRQRIWRFSKTAGDPELKRIDKVAVKHHLYAPMGADGQRTDALEKKLGDLEQWFGEPYWKAACNDFPDYGDEAWRKMMALLVATTYLRNPLQYKHWKAMHRRLVDQIEAWGEPPAEMIIKDKTYQFDVSTWPAYRDADDEALKASWNDYVGQAAGIAEHFLHMRWAVLFSEKPVFITSDNPVMLGDSVTPYRGIQHPDTIVTFPISPTRVLMMDNRHSEPGNRYYPLDGSPAPMNLLIWRNAIDHMYSHRPTDEVLQELDDDAQRMMGAA